MISNELLQRVAKDASSEPDKSKEIARNIFLEVNAIEGKIEASRTLATNIEKRPWYKAPFASSSEDLVNVTRAQNEINDEMFGLIQKTIGLNVLSYAGLASLLDEFRRCVENGLADANGKVVRLSSEGKELAETATTIISGILEGSRETQDSLSLNAGNIEQLRLEMEQKGELDSSQDRAIERLEAKIVALTEQVGELQGTLRHSHEAANARFSHLEKGHSRWRTATVAVAILPLAWLVAMTWF